MTGPHLTVAIQLHRALPSRPRSDLAPFANAVPGLWAAVALRPTRGARSTTGGRR